MKGVGRQERQGSGRSRAKGERQNARRMTNQVTPERLTHTLSLITRFRYREKACAATQQQQQQQEHARHPAREKERKSKNASRLSPSACLSIRSAADADASLSPSQPLLSKREKNGKQEEEKKFNAASVECMHTQGDRHAHRRTCMLRRRQLLMLLCWCVCDRVGSWHPAGMHTCSPACMHACGGERKQMLGVVGKRFSSFYLSLTRV